MLKMLVILNTMVEKKNAGSQNLLDLNNSRCMLSNCSFGEER